MRGRFYAVMANLEDDPFRPRPACDIRGLDGGSLTRAIRVGRLRGIYEVEGKVVRFTTFGRRPTVYDQ